MLPMVSNYRFFFFTYNKLGSLESDLMDTQGYQNLCPATEEDTL